MCLSIPNIIINPMHTWSNLVPVRTVAGERGQMPVRMLQLQWKLVQRTLGLASYIDFQH